MPYDASRASVPKKAFVPARCAGRHGSPRNPFAFIRENSRHSRSLIASIGSRARSPTEHGGNPRSSAASANQFSPSRHRAPRGTADPRAGREDDGSGVPSPRVAGMKLGLRGARYPSRAAVSSTFPVVFRDANAWCASPAFSSEKRAPIRTDSSCACTQPSSSLARDSSSSRVAT